MAGSPAEVDIGIDDLERPVPQELGVVQPSSPVGPRAAGVESFMLGELDSVDSSRFVPSSLFQQGFYRGMSRGISHEYGSCGTPVAMLPSVRHGLSSTQFHPGAVARGVSPNVLLHSGGALLQNGAARRNDHQLSQELKRESLDMFISHSWTVGRWRKFLVMALYFNGQQAAIISLLVQALSFAGVLTGVLPIVAADTTELGISMWCFIFGSLAFWLSVLFWHELMIAGCCKRRAAMAFFDTVCIDQSDEEKIREGIEAITAYLCHSKKLFVVLSEVYLQRIWTVFEMAAFLAVSHSQYQDSQAVQRPVHHTNGGSRPNAGVIVQPVALATLIPACFLFQLSRPVGDFARYTFKQTEKPDGTRNLAALALAWALIILGVFVIVILVRILERWGQTRQQLAQQVDTFSFASAECHHEPDRHEIALAVKYLAERTGLVDSEASLKDAQAALESHARGMVWPAMAGALSPAGIPPWDAWLIALPVMAVALDEFAVTMAHEDQCCWDWDFIFLSFLSDVSASLNFPIVIALVSISACRTRRGACFEAMATLLGVSATFCFVSTRGLMNGMLMAVKEDRGVRRLDAILSVTLVIQALVLWCCYGSGLWYIKRLCRSR